MILMNIFILFDFPVPLLTRSMKTVAKRGQQTAIAANYLLLSKHLLLYDRPNISVYLNPKKHHKESSIFFKIKHSRVTSKIN